MASCRGAEVRSWRGAAVAYHHGVAVTLCRAADSEAIPRRGESVEALFERVSLRQFGLASLVALATFGAALLAVGAMVPRDVRCEMIVVGYGLFVPTWLTIWLYRGGTHGPVFVWTDRIFDWGERLTAICILLAVVVVGIEGVRLVWKGLEAVWSAMIRALL